jgi:hypothetical protein
MLESLKGFKTVHGNYKFICKCGGVIRVYPQKYYELPAFVICSKCKDVFYLDYPEEGTKEELEEML